VSNTIDFISNSITNPNSIKILDNDAPFTFFEYLKQISDKVSPINFNDLYIEYISVWSQIKNKNKIFNQNEIKNRYVELLKDLTLKYTTAEEKRFLVNIDYNDEFDLDIVIPFYSKKIIEICEYFCRKRELIKFKNDRNKNKGSINSINRAIFETITDVIFSDVLEVGVKQSYINVEDLYKDLDIEIEELYDLYTNYLDNDPSLSYDAYNVKSDLRKKLYTSNINDISANIFYNIDEAVKEQIFEDIRIFLTEFKKNFSINYDLSVVNLNCNVGEPLYNLVSSSKENAKKIVELRYSLIKKYIGCDFYYIQTSDVVDNNYKVELLFKADNPSGNLLNRHFPTTASVEEESDLQSCRRIGLFFTPDKNSILYFSAAENKYKIDTTKLELNKLYIFPDPNRYGNTSGISNKYNSDYPLIHIQDYTRTIYNQSYNMSEGDIKIKPTSQTFYSYFSKNQSENKFSGYDSLNYNFSRLGDMGLIHSWASDIYGNEYCLIKPSKKKNLITIGEIPETYDNICMDYDGGPFVFDSGEQLPEAITTQNAKWVYPNVWASNYYYNLYIDGSFAGTPKGIMWHGIFSGLVVDGLGITRNNSTVLSLNLNIDENGKIIDVYDGKYFDNTGIIFDTIINNNVNDFKYSLSYNIDGNYFNNNPNNQFSVEFEKTLDGNSSIASGLVPEFVTNNTYILSSYILSSIKYREFDGGLIIDVCDQKFDFNRQTKFIIKERFSDSYTISSFDTLEVNPLPNPYGKIFVRNISNNQIYSLEECFGNQFIKYNNDIKYELYNNVLDFNIYNDFIWIRTLNYIIFDKISYVDGVFTDSGTNPNFLINSEQCSNPFIFENKNYCFIASLSIANIENVINQSIIPTIYKLDFDNYTLNKIYKGDITDYLHQTTYSNVVKYKHINCPKLFYNSRNDVYGIATTIEDQNQYPFIYKLKFEYDGSSIYNLYPRIIRMYDNVYENIETLNLNTTNNLSLAVEFNDMSPIIYGSRSYTSYFIGNANNSITFY
jgi:hypothetical protein